MTYKTTGTLKEIGAKVGDVVERDGGRTFEVDQWKLEYWAHTDCRIISRATHTGPVRTVTKKEIAVMTPRNLHIECNPNETPLNAVRRALKNLRIGHTASIESFTLATGESLPPDIVDDLINMSSSKRVYMTWIEETSWQVRVHVLYAEDVDQEDEYA